MEVYSIIFEKDKNGDYKDGIINLTDNNAMQKQFFLDVDGIILDFETGFINFLRDQFDPNISKDFIPTSWDMEGDFPHLNIKQAYQDFILSDSMSKIPPLLSSREFNAISQKYPVYLLTNIHPHSIKHREKNLSDYGFRYSDMFFAGLEKHQEEQYPGKPEVVKKIQEQGKEIIFLDDLPQNCIDMKQSHPECRVFLMSRPHNLKVPDNKEWRRVENWSTFVKEISS